MFKNSRVFLIAGGLIVGRARVPCRVDLPQWSLRGWHYL